MTPKPVDLLRRVVKIASEPGDLILDSFAGSGTTAHSVMAVNGEDTSNRKWVLVQLPHETKDDAKERRNLCETITRLRVEKVIKGYSYNGQKKKNVKVPGLSGTFTYARVGEPLFGEYRDFGKTLPEWETLARYIFYTESGQECDSRKLKPKSGFIGATAAAGGTSYYLFYSPDDEENQRVSLRTLPALVKKDKNKNLVIYAERVWLHGDELARFEAEHRRKIRPMVIPFGLK